jgi:hypothetical protein
MLEEACIYIGDCELSQMVFTCSATLFKTQVNSFTQVKLLILDNVWGVKKIIATRNFLDPSITIRLLLKRWVAWCAPFSCAVEVYHAHELIKFIKNLKNHTYFFILLYMCIKFYVQIPTNEWAIKKTNFLTYLKSKIC